MTDQSVGHRPSPWYQRDFRIAWAAGFINNTGDWVLLIALPVFVFVETKSGTATAMLFVAQLVAGSLLGPFGGVLVDRFDLKRCLVATNLAQAVTILPLLAVNSDRIWPAYLVIAIQAALTQVNNPANVALLPRVVQKEDLAASNAALSAAESLARLGGAPIGGLLVAWGGLVPIVVVDGLSFLIVAVGIRFLRSDTSPIPTPDGASHGVRDGIRTAREHHPVAPLLLLETFAQVAQGGFSVLFVVFIIDTLGDNGTSVGLIRGTMAIGALAGAAIVARAPDRARPTSLYAVGLFGMGAISLVFWNAPALTTNMWVYVVLFALSGIPGSALAVGLYTTLQTHSPAHSLGRITGLLGAGATIGVATGSILAGLLVDHVSLTTLLNSQATIYLIAATGAAVFIVRPRSQRVA